jgi:hypothetical protein
MTEREYKEYHGCGHFWMDAWWEFDDYIDRSGFWFVDYDLLAKFKARSTGCSRSIQTLSVTC